MLAFIIPNLGFPEIMMIMLLALLLFGPKKIPEIGRTLGKGLREFKRSTSGFMDSINQDMKEMDAKPTPQAKQMPAEPKPTASLAPPEREAPEDVHEAEIVIDLEGDKPQR